MRGPRLALAGAALVAFAPRKAHAAGSAAAGQTFLWLAVILPLAQLGAVLLPSFR